ncbi:MAG TPA: hypothetical protein PKH43_13610, partial [Saprospiraceae bacterium]|nr:hypothetical protein [Saprospiraceae bacterium]
MTTKFLPVIALTGMLMAACAPERDDDIQLPPAPGAPSFSVAFLPNDPNRVVITDLSEGNFQRLWDLPGGNPKSSTKAVDTVQYAKAGEYVITLYVSKSDGSGTSSATQKVTIDADAALDCNSKLALL